VAKPSFKLEPSPSVDEQAEEIGKYLCHLVTTMLSGFLDGYSWDVSAVQDEFFARHLIKLRVSTEGASRATLVFAYNWYHRDSPKNVKRKIDKKFVAFAERCKTRLVNKIDRERIAAKRAAKEQRALAAVDKNKSAIEANLSALEELLE
jgi:hypothetical protein